MSLESTKFSEVDFGHVPDRGGWVAWGVGMISTRVGLDFAAPLFRVLVFEFWGAWLQHRASVHGAGGRGGAVKAVRRLEKGGEG